MWATTTTSQPTNRKTRKKQKRQAKENEVRYNSKKSQIEEQTATRVQGRPRTRSYGGEKSVGLPTRIHKPSEKVNFAKENSLISPIKKPNNA